MPKKKNQKHFVHVDTKHQSVPSSARIHETKWSTEEMSRLYDGLRKYGKDDVVNVQRCVQTKTMDEVQSYMKSLTLRAVFGTQIQIKAPIENWIQTTGELLVGESDYSDILAKVISIAGNLEPHQPADPGRYPDFRAIYTYIADLLRGQEPEELNLLESMVVLDLLQDLANTLGNMELKDQRKLLLQKHEIINTKIEIYNKQQSYNFIAAGLQQDLLTEEELEKLKEKYFSSSKPGEGEPSTSEETPVKEKPKRGKRKGGKPKEPEPPLLKKNALYSLNPLCIPIKYLNPKTVPPPEPPAASRSSMTSGRPHPMTGTQIPPRRGSVIDPDNPTSVGKVYIPPDPVRNTIPLSKGSHRIMVPTNTKLPAGTFKAVLKTDGDKGEFVLMSNDRELRVEADQLLMIQNIVVAKDAGSEGFRKIQQMKLEEHNRPKEVRRSRSTGRRSGQSNEYMSEDLECMSELIVPNEADQSKDGDEEMVIEIVEDYTDLKKEEDNGKDPVTQGEPADSDKVQITTQKPQDKIPAKNKRTKSNEPEKIEQKNKRRKSSEKSSKAESDEKADSSDKATSKKTGQAKRKLSGEKDTKTEKQSKGANEKKGRRKSSQEKSPETEKNEKLPGPSKSKKRKLSGEKSNVERKSSDSVRVENGSKDSEVKGEKNVKHNERSDAGGSKKRKSSGEKSKRRSLEAVTEELRNK